jgi:hypothetical protein
MATYKQIFGKQVKFLSADPPASIGEGQIWYNSTTDTFKSSVVTGAWSSGGALSNATHSSNSSFGSTPAGVMVGGTTPTGPITANTELYDGTTWTANPNACPFSIGYGTGGGTQTAGIVCSGENPPGSGTATAKFDGSAWTSAPSRSTGTTTSVGIGSQSSFIQVAGVGVPAPPYAALTVVETFNGSAWATESNSYPVGFSQGFGGGTEAAAIIGGGDPGITASNTWDGSAWTAAGAMLASRYRGAYAGTSTNAYQIGGYNNPSGGHTDTTVFDGTTWGTNPSTATGSSGSAGAGQTGGVGGVIKMGGQYGTQLICEEFAEAVTVETITTS